MASNRKSVWDCKSGAQRWLEFAAQAESAQHDGQSGHVRGRDRQRDHHGAADSAAARAHFASTCRSRCGCGSPCCSPTSPRPWPKAAAKRRPKRCARRARRPWPSASTRERQDRRDSAARSCAPAIWCRSLPANSSQATEKSSKASRRWTNPPSPANPRR